VGTKILQYFTTGSSFQVWWQILTFFNKD